MIEHAVKYSTYDFMKKHEYQFDEKLSKRARNEACGLPQIAGMSKGKIDSGKWGNGKQKLSGDLCHAIWNKWTEIVEPVTGCATYDEWLVSIEIVVAFILCANIRCVSGGIMRSLSET